MSSPRKFNKNSLGINESIVWAPRSPQDSYPYRSGLGMFQSAEYGHFMDDFTSLVTSNLPAGWAANVKDTNGTVLATTSTTMTNTNRAHGVLEFAGSSASDGSAIYRPKTFIFDTGSRWFMEVRVACDTPAEQDIQFGLSSVTASTNPEDLYTTAADSLVSFGISASATTAKLIYDKANAGPQSDSATITSITASTWYIFALEYTGATAQGVNCYINGNKVLTSTVAAKIPNGVLLAPFVAFRNGATTTGKGWIDYFRYATDR